LAKGFSEALVLQVEGTRTEGAEICDFYFRYESLDEEDFKLLKERKEKLGSKAKKGWYLWVRELYLIILSTNLKR